MLNPLYDSVVIGLVKQVCLPPSCPDEESALLEIYGNGFSQQIEPVLSSHSSNGYFFDSCIVHCQTTSDLWTEIAIDGRTIAQVVGDWYFERSTDARLKDCDTDLPCNPTCPDFGDPTTSKFDGAVRTIVSPSLLLLSLYTTAAFVY